ncbi:MAG: hypothetical protein J7K33_01310 [Candidatus Marinimicrobia bacterium]|nr:hypothetical protein [Candidatus Neomarinimicrobiota bacterium]
MSLLCVFSIYKAQSLGLVISLIYISLFYIINLYFVIHYRQTDPDPVRMIEYMLLHGKISHAIIQNPKLSYFSYPFSFIFGGTLILIVGIGRISIYNIGLFIFVGIFYIGLFLYYRSNIKRKEDEIRFVTISLALYVIVSFYIINDQFSPQTFAMALLPYLYWITQKAGESPTSILKKTILTIIFWFALVFSHPFLFLFYLLPVIGITLYIKINTNKIKKTNLAESNTMVWMLISIWALGFAHLFYVLLDKPLRVFLETWGHPNENPTVLIENFLGKGYTLHPHYEIVPKWFVYAQGLFVRILWIGAITLVVYSFILAFKSAITRTKPHYRLVFDTLVVISGGALFALSFISKFLGPRAFQIIYISLSGYIKELRSKKIFMLLIVLILIMAPTLLTLNSMVNLTVGNHVRIREPLTLNAGSFLDTYGPTIKEYSVLTCSAEPYPIKINANKYTFAIWSKSKKPLSQFDYILWSRKIEMGVEYYGITKKFQKELQRRSMIYNNGFSKVFI